MVYYPGRTGTDHGGYGEWETQKPSKSSKNVETTMKIQYNYLH